MTITTKAEFLTLLKGSTFLASGGGGPYSLAKKVVDHYFSDSDTFSIEITDVSALTQDDWGCVAAGMAEPSKVLSLPAQDFIEPTVNAVNAMETLLKDIVYNNASSKFKEFTSFKRLLPVEIGAMNVAIPLITAYKAGNGMTVVNGDCAGRSIPTINLTTFSTTQSVMPNMAASVGTDDFKFSTLSLDSYDDLNKAYSQLIGSGLIGSESGLSMAPMNGTTIQDNNIVANTLEYAHKIGEIMENDDNTWLRAIHIQECLAPSNRGVQLLCTGKVVAYTTESIDDNDVGYISIETLANSEGIQRIFTISIQNETITGQFEDETCIAVSGPDSICYLSSSDGALSDGEIYDNVLIQEQFEKGEDVNIHVIAIQADQVVTNNPELMTSWKTAYKMARYYGAYNSQIWATI